VTRRLDDPHWPTAGQWIAGRHRPDPLGTVGLLGIPLCKGSITPGRCDLAPDAIREALERFSTYDLAEGHDLCDLAVRDFGNLALADATPGEAAAEIVAVVSRRREEVDLLVIFGGDNSLTRPACVGSSQSLANCALLTLDAHLDLRDLDPGPTNGNPVRGLLDDGLSGSHIVQVGIQSFANSQVYTNVARAAGIEVITVEKVRSIGTAEAAARALARLGEGADTIYVDIDIDVLDRVFAPACPGSRPGGLLPFELFEAARMCGAYHKVAVVDLVEVDPARDCAQATVFAAARCFLSLASGFRSRFEAGGEAVRGAAG
jgi:formiminoglutamase